MTAEASHPGKVPRVLEGDAATCTLYAVRKREKANSAQFWERTEADAASSVC